MKEVNFAKVIRKNIGTVVVLLGFMLLCIITFGDLGELFAEQYWTNVLKNITSISFMSIGLTCIQTVIKSGLAEQALQRGLNTELTASKYEEHRALIRRNCDKQQYLPYFLQVYNKKHTKLCKRDFLVNNNYSSEASLYASGSKRLIKRYENIVIHITTSSIKWSTVDIIYDKHGRIVTLDEYRRNRLVKQIIMSFVCMVGVTFLTSGLFFATSGEPLWQKFVKLFTYMISIAIGAVFTVIKEYEKGAFCVPNELDEINEIWNEFEAWEVPDCIRKELEEINESEEKEVEQEKSSSIDTGANLQEEQKEIEVVRYTRPGNMVCVSFVDDTIPNSNVEEQCRQCDGDTRPVRQEEIYRDGVTSKLSSTDK